jgi:hypothetical protein
VRPEVNFLHLTDNPLLFLIEVSMRLVRQWSTWALLVAALSCGSDKTSTFGETSGSGSGGSGGSGATGGADGGKILDGGIITTGGSGGGVGGSGQGGTFGDDAKICAGVDVGVETLPFNMLIMFDQSSSMLEPLDGLNPPSRWDALTAALIEYFQSDEAKPLSIGLSYFEQIDPTTFMTSCRVADYTTPEIEIGAMNDGTQAQRLVDSLRSHQPTGLTPTAAALQGALTHAKAYTMAHPGRQTMVVFATDGLPTRCDPMETYLIAQNIALPAFQGTPSIRTFVVASAVGLTALGAISSAGGTGQPVYVTDPKTTSDQIRTAFNRLSRTNFSCSYRIPMGGDGGRTDPGQVNVMVREAGKGDRRLTLYNSPNSCGDGWYYDNPSKPENIMLCPMTCQNLFNGELHIVIGCAGPPPM